MLNKKPTITTVAVLTGAILGLGATSSSPIQPAQAEEKPSMESAITNEKAAEKLNQLYNRAFIGKSISYASDFQINKTTQKEVHKALGQPMPANENSEFDIYTATMGSPGFGFSYNENGTIQQIRYFGRNVERQQDIGGVTPAVLSSKLGSADNIRFISSTGEMNYIYKTGKYEIQFVIGRDNTVSHVNLMVKE
ncbi:YjgB family protein [Niallia nealsonii]|uniref:DUF4309 domain-containing protein n=1 Tax=Niallia nealsonii TaxID=115979 RepID=A0A2N0Z556_9BACI|nr:YjgB family protein [Niallia nealsonii]PKG24655.1 hypothetical protein CWS01_05195 [Niallia nealsonii]